MESLAVLAAMFAGLGGLFAVVGLILTRRFARKACLDPWTGVTAVVTTLPPVTVLKPLCGPEPALEEALASFCTQDHPCFQIVFGVQDPHDPAVAVVARLRKRFPGVEMTLVVDPTPHGKNRKVANLINMLPSARHDILVMADSDLHVAPDYLRQVQASLAQPGVGLVTTLYVGQPVVAGWAARLAASHLSHTFLPGAVLARALGRQDCLGTTMALTRQTLGAVGGPEALSPHLADDNVLGQLVLRSGQSVRLADTMPIAAVQENRLRDVWTHELRWARTIGALAPVAYAASALQYPIAWALVACVLSGFQPWCLAVLVASWGMRAATSRGIDVAVHGMVGRRLAPVSLWLLPVRDILSLAQIVVSYRGRGVVWKGHAMRADAGLLRRLNARPAPIGGARTRIAGGVLLALIGGGAAFAQQPTAAQKQAIQQSCRADYQSHCASVPPGGAAALSCLKDNAAALSGGCQSALAALGGASKQAGSAKPATITPPPEEHLTIRQACGADFAKYCRGIRPIGTCVRANEDRLSPACKHTLMSLRDARPRPSP